MYIYALALKVNILVPLKVQEESIMRIRDLFSTSICKELENIIIIVQKGDLF